MVSLMPKQEKSTKPRRGRPPRGVAVKAFQIRLPMDLHRELKLLSVDTDESMNALLERAVTTLLAETRRR